jgi:hypothetical protein
VLRLVSAMGPHLPGVDALLAADSAPLTGRAWIGLHASVLSLESPSLPRPPTQAEPMKTFAVLSPLISVALAPNESFKLTGSLSAYACSRRLMALTGISSYHIAHRWAVGVDQRALHPLIDSGGPCALCRRRL